ncbi:anti-sigma factor [Yonghaparkia sp. Root332]|uniref:anti-sigma factor n=1 Tax=Yonghaparkia sp. Root332 TaxID=1736516 RepID=UPI0009EC0769|nr:anti-sigma factor [Yonghaparkia sp. Root332]
MEQHDSDRAAHDRSDDDALAHLDAEAIALIAIGEAPSSLGESRHLAVCPACRSELDQLHGAAEIARTTIGEGAFVAPSSAVWAGIHRELGLAADVRPPGLDTDPASEPVASAPAAPVRSLADERARRGRMRRLIAPVAGIAAAAVAVGAVALSWEALRPAPESVTVARAALDALPAWQGSTGTAVVSETADGERVVSIELDASVEADGVREVWLLTPEVDGLISLGLLEGGSGTFVIPDGIDLAEYPIVDVSLEPVDGDPAHSGDSIVRGALDV